MRLTRAREQFHEIARAEKNNTPWIIWPHYDQSPQSQLFFVLTQPLYLYSGNFPSFLINWYWLYWWDWNCSDGSNIKLEFFWASFPSCSSRRETNLLFCSFLLTLCSHILLFLYLRYSILCVKSCSISLQVPKDCNIWFSTVQNWVREINATQ